MRAAIIVAGGTGERFGVPGGKQLAVVAGRPVVAHAVAAFEAAASIDAIIVVTHPERVEEYRAAVTAPIASKLVAVVAGGATRQASIAAGLRALPQEADLVAVHDGARPLVAPATIDSAVAMLERNAELDGVVVGHPAYDTMKQVDAAGRIMMTPERSSLWAALTPQVFRREVLERAHAAADREGRIGTDDSALVEAIGGRVAMMLGPRDNIKVTVAEDLELIEERLRRRNGGIE